MPSAINTLYKVLQAAPLKVDRNGGKNIEVKIQKGISLLLVSLLLLPVYTDAPAKYPIRAL